jgi:hypothetical protein
MGLIGVRLYLEQMTRDIWLLTTFLAPKISTTPEFTKIPEPNKINKQFRQSFPNSRLDDLSTRNLMRMSKQGGSEILERTRVEANLHKIVIPEGREQDR